ncbi:MAG: Thiamine-monophosphate kinase [Nitrospira sp.]
MAARHKARASLREFDLIRSLRRLCAGRDASLRRGIGDDTAVTAGPPGRDLLLTTDLLADGVHFDRRTAAFFDIGFRSAAANLSDIAAMGGAPKYLLIALAIPDGATGRQVRELYRGMMAACRPHHVLVIGGDTSASTGGWFIGVTAVGTVERGRALLRSGARVGDAIYVTGTLGDSLAGLALANERLRPIGQRHQTNTLSSRHRRFLLKRHLRPDASVAAGRWLVRERLASSAIDLSDGLSGDIRHLCEESRVGAEIDTASLPLSQAGLAYAEATGSDPIRMALTGGEDYELLFTTPSRLCGRLERTARRKGFHLTKIGTIRPARFGIRARSAEGLRPLPVTSYRHFQLPRGES